MTPSAAAAPQRPSPLAVAVALAAVYVVWGSTYYAMRLALGGLPPFLMAGGRFLLAGAILYGALRLRGAPSPTRSGWLAAAKVGGLLLVVGNGAVAYAQQWVNSSLAAVVVSTMPLWAALFARLVGERPSRAEWLGLLIGFIGVVILNAGGELNAQGPRAMVLLIAPVSWAIGSVWSRRLPLPAGPMASAAQMLVAGAGMLLIGALRGEHVMHAPPPSAIAAFFYLVVFGSLVGFSAYTWLLTHVRPALATSYAYVNPLIALLLGGGLGGEHISRLTVVAATVIIVGVGVLNLRPGRR